MSVECSVVIPAYNASGTIQDQLEALATQDFAGSFEVVVADNGSTDDLDEVVAAYGSRLDVRVVDASARRGPSAARNIGVEHTSSERLLFCDADDVVCAEWVTSLMSALDDHSFVGGPYEPFSSKQGIWLPSYPKDQLPVAWEWAYTFGGNFGIAADIWRALGGFDESLTGAEEIEFAWRARELGLVPGFVPSAKVAYRVRASVRGRLWHEYNSGSGTQQLARRLGPEYARVRSRRSHVRHVAMLLSRFPRSRDGGRWAAWAALLAYSWGERAGAVR